MSLQQKIPPDILMVIKTQGLAYDDRLRKEVVSLSKRLSVEISCVERERNTRSVDKAYGRIETSTYKVYAREIFKPGSGVFLKAVEVNLWLFRDVLRKRSRVVWVHDPDMIGLVLLSLLARRLGRVSKVVWDQHELPRYVKSKFGRFLLRTALHGIDTLICTNAFRRDFLVDTLDVTPEQVVIIENYPDRQSIDIEPQPLPPEVAEWLDGEPYFLAQGGGRPDRYHHELVEACGTVGKRLIIIGNVQGARAASDRVYYTGQIPQSDIIPFTDNCIASVVLYETKTPNTRFCSPNRLFHALGRKKPVVVGCNPPMKNIMDDARAGVVLRADGADVGDIVDGLRRLLDDYENHSQRAASVSNDFVWERQESELFDAARLPPSVGS